MLIPGAKVSGGGTPPSGTSATPAYDELTTIFRRLYRLGHVEAIVHWDGATCMPPGGNAARTDALAELAALTHRVRTDPRLKQLLDRCGDEPLTEAQRVSRREMLREWRRANALPAELIERQHRATGRCEHAWREQRPRNDWAGFLTNFRAVVAVAREQAQRLADDTGLARYDALMDRYEPGMTAARLDILFADLRGWLPALIEAGLARQARHEPMEPQGPYPVEGQKALGARVMRLLGFDFDHGRLDVTVHPFCGGVAEDVRIATRYSEREFLGSLLATIHETGHGRYEQGRPAEWLGLPVGEARSMGLHESQSLFFEMQLAGHRGFAAHLAPLLREHLGDQPAFAADNLHRLINRVAPGPIRVEADELTYPAHVILRYEIERALIEGEIEAEDILALWDEGMRDWLGLDTRGNFKDGPMQDIHWPEGLIGYFPSYVLGAMYAAQWADALRKRLPFDALVETGDLAPIFAWLRDNIWRQASLHETDELVVRASGRALDPDCYRAHLAARHAG